ncbi:MAG: CoA transferase, partial [Hyphomicrobiales bacterium]|nr:CoA transferase [Hyphomicrobiales bacterium]
MMLEGVRVIDLGSFITAPLAAMMLGDMGADVIKVERPDGDPFRRGHGTNYGPTFLAFNRNKRSVVIDATTPQGRAAQGRLIDGADVLIDNYRTPVLRKLGLDPDELRARNPRLIHCSITGFGAKGPYRDRPAFDSVGQALSGITSLLVDPDAPRAFGPTITDNVTGMYAAYGVMGALVERGRTGLGKRLEVNMLESSMAFIQDIYTNYTRTHVVSDRFTRIARSQCFAFRCADGALLSVHLSTTEKFWREFASAIGADDIAADERYSTHQARVKHYHELTQALAERMAMRPRADWIARFAAADVPFSPIHTVADALHDPQVAALGTAISMRHPTQGEVMGVACPVTADCERPRADMRA